jgi:SAM-dependent methyltransferase
VSRVARWQDVECGSYTADLELWERLAGARGGPVLDLGAGTGRVALHLARLWHSVVAVDHDPELVAELECRAAAEQLPVEAIAADVCSLALDRSFPLVLAPMQLLQLLAREERAECLRAISAHLAPGGLAAIALLEGRVPAEGPTPLPDLRELDGWVYSSQPVAVRRDRDGLTVIRHRQTVSPSGALSEEDDEVHLHALSPGALEAEAAEAGLAPHSREPVAPSGDHVGSTVVVLREAG